MRGPVRHLLGALALLVLFGCGLTDATVEERGAGTLTIGPMQTLELETWNGGIEVSTCASFDLRVNWVKRGAGSSDAAARADLSNVEVVLEKTPAGARVAARRKDGKTSGASGARLEVCAPPGTKVRARTSNGPIRLAGPGGDVVATTSNGSIEVKDASGRVHLQTSNGQMTVAGRDLVVDLKTSNGSVKLEGSLAAGDHRVETSNGRVEITLPSDTQFALAAKTSNGSVSCEFPLTPALKGRPKAVEGSTGPKPPVRLSLSSSNGSIEVRKLP